jgi:hypothetical protein
MKGYITGWVRRKEREQAQIEDFSFDSHIQEAMHWRTKEEADADRVMFENWGIQIPSAEGGVHTCKTFVVEERALGEFVICCDAPFVHVDTGTARVPESRTGYKSALSSFNPVAIKSEQTEVNAPEHITWGTVTCGACGEQFVLVPSPLYGFVGAGLKNTT